VLKERTSIWDTICDASGGETKVKNICSVCKASQVEKDRLTCVAAAERAEGEVTVDDGSSDVPESKSNMCCISCTLSQQQDFLDQKPLIQCYIEEQDHICMFLLKFHCKLDPIEMYWGWTKHSMFFGSVLSLTDDSFMQNITLHPTVNLRLQKGLSRKFLTQSTLSFFGSSFVRPGDIWMHMSELNYMLRRHLLTI
jgi:hypothetical protein